MKENVEIFDISYDGAGVGKLGDKICFVPKTLPGEMVSVKVLNDNGRYFVCACEKIVKQSPFRIKAFCPYFDVCGGCDFQHCEYEQEQAFKKQILRKELSKVGFCGEIKLVPCAKRFFYRNKIKLEVCDAKLGYFKSKSHDFFEIKTCPIADKEILKALPYVEEFLKNNKLTGLKNVYLKKNAGRISVCFLFDKKAKIDEKNIQKTSLFDEFDVLFAFGEILESDKTKIVKASDIVGQGHKPDKNSQTFDMRAFQQVNDEIAQKLYGEVLKGLTGKKAVNAYAGQGLLTFKISEKARFVYGIEVQASAHAEAEETCACQKNVKNICGKVEDELAKITKTDKIDLIVLDPARAGCQKVVLQEIIARKIPEIVYISCNFATLTRDLKILKDDYDIENVEIFDMFPCTANMETLVKLKRKN